MRSGESSVTESVTTAGDCEASIVMGRAPNTGALVSNVNLAEVDDAILLAASLSLIETRILVVVLYVSRI